MIVTGKNTVTLFNDFDERARSIHQLLTKNSSDEDKKVLLDKAKEKFLQDVAVDVEPKLDDYAYVPFRHISKTIVGADSYKATDFSVGNVLKDSVKMMDGINAYTNHFAYVGNQIGKVLNPEWGNSFTNAKGEKVPAGINAPFVIDKVLHPKLVRELNSLVGSPVDSASVTVGFTWEASHEFERDYDFFYHLGEMIEGSMVRRIATSVVGYDESSLVWSGADPYAKILSKPTAVEREMATASNKFSKCPELAQYDSGRRFYIFDSENEVKISQFEQASLSFTKNSPINKSNSMKKLVQLVALSLGIAADAVEKMGDEELEQKLAILKKEEFTALKSTDEKVKQLQTQVTELTQAKTTLEEDKVTLTSEKAALEADAKVGKTVLTRTKESAKKLYNTFTNGKPDEKIVQELEAATDVESLEAKVKLFGGKAYQAFGAKCGSCGSTDVTMRSSGEEFDQEDPADKKTVERPMWQAARS